MISHYEPAKSGQHTIPSLFRIRVTVPPSIKRKVRWPEDRVDRLPRWPALYRTNSFLSPLCLLYRFILVYGAAFVAWNETIEIIAGLNRSHCSNHHSKTLVSGNCSLQRHSSKTKNQIPQASLSKPKTRAHVWRCQINPTARVRPVHGVSHRPQRT